MQTGTLAAAVRSTAGPVLVDFALANQEDGAGRQGRDDRHRKEDRGHAEKADQPHRQQGRGEIAGVVPALVVADRPVQGRMADQSQGQRAQQGQKKRLRQCRRRKAADPPNRAGRAPAATGRSRRPAGSTRPPAESSAAAPGPTIMPAGVCMRKTPRPASEMATPMAVSDHCLPWRYAPRNGMTTPVISARKKLAELRPARLCPEVLLGADLVVELRDSDSAASSLAFVVPIIAANF